MPGNNDRLSGEEKGPEEVAPDGQGKKSIGASLKKGFAIFQQQVKETVGKVKPSEEDAELVNKITLFMNTKTDMAPLLKDCKKYYEYGMESLQYRSRVKDTMASMFSVAKEGKDATQAQDFVTSELALVAEEKKVLEEFKKAIIDPIDQLLNVDMKECMRLHGEYKDAHRLNDFEHSKKNAKPETIKEAEANYVKASKLLSDKCDEVERQKVAIFTENLRVFYTFRLAFARDAVDTLQGKDRD